MLNIERLETDEYADERASLGNGAKIRLKSVMQQKPERVTIRNRVSIPMPGGVVGEFVSFDGLTPAAEHLAIVFGTPDISLAPLVRMHSECLTGDLFGSLRCDCGPQLTESIDHLGRDGGVLLYLRQEGRGIGLMAKLDAYRLQDQGLDTYAANKAMNLPADGREYACGAAMLKALGITTIRLLSNNPDKARQLRAAGISIKACLPTGAFVTPFNRRYLKSKVEQTGHHIEL